MHTFLVNLSLALSLALFLTACGNDDSGQQTTTETAEQTTNDSAPAGTESAAVAEDSAEVAEAPAEVSEAPAAASDEPAESGGGDPANGETLFNQPVIGGVPGCVTCHSLQPGVRMVGPSLADIATVAAETAEGMSAQEFLRQSITDPNAHVTEGFAPGLMYQKYDEDLTQEQIDDLVAFLLTLE